MSSKNAYKRIEVVSVKMVKESSVLYKNRKITTPEEALELGKEFLHDLDREELIVCSLNTKNQPTTVNIVSVGSLNSSIVHPREVFKVAILSNAASIIIYHNHPSGDPTPSIKDMDMTKRLKECGEILGISILDHIIIGDEKYYSFKFKGTL